MIEHPPGHGLVVRTENEAAGGEKGDGPHLPERPDGCFAHMGTVPFFSAQQHHRMNVGRSHDVPGGDPRDLLAALRGRQLAAHRIKRRRAPLAPPRRLGLKLHASRQAADHQARQKHHQKRQYVLRIVDRELPARRHKTEVKRGNAQNRGQNGRPPPQPQHHGNHSQQIDHRQVGGRFHVRRKQPAQRRANHHRRQRPQIVDLAVGQEPRGRRGRRRRLRVAANHVNVDVAALSRQLIDQRAAKQLSPSRLLGLAHDNLGDVPLAGVMDQLVGDALAAQGGRLAAQLLGQPQRLRKLLAAGVGKVGGGRRFDVDRHPRRLQAVRHAAGGPHQPGRKRTRADADQQALAGRPRTRHGVFAAVYVHLLAHPLGRLPQGQFPQCNQISLGEEVGNRPLGLAGDVDLALAQALQQVVWRDVDQFHLVGLLEDRVGHRLADHHAGDLGDHVVEAFEVLDVQRRIDVDARLQQPHYVLPALGVRHAGKRGLVQFRRSTRRAVPANWTCPLFPSGNVSVGQLIDDQKLRMQGQGGVKIELPELRASVFNLQPREHVEAQDEGLGFRPDVRLDIADDDVHALLAHLAGRFEHGVRFADAGGRAEEDFQLPPLLFGLFGLNAGKQGIRIGTLGGHDRIVAGKRSDAPRCVAAVCERLSLPVIPRLSYNWVGSSGAS